MDTKPTSLPPYDNNGTHSKSPHIPRIRNFRKLLATLAKHAAQEQLLTATQTKPSSSSTSLSDSSDADSDFDTNTGLVTIYPANQLVQLEARAHDVSSFNANADLLCIFGDGRNRWLDYTKKPVPPPLPLHVARLIMSPALCTLWRAKLSPSPSRTSQLSPATAAALTLSTDLMHLLIVQGQSASETRRFIAVESLHEAASTLFNELANGYSVVFVGLMFKSEFENRMLQGKAYQICKSVDDLRHWQGHQAGSSSMAATTMTVTTGGQVGPTSRSVTPSGLMGRDKNVKGKELPEEPKKYLGIIC